MERLWKMASVVGRYADKIKHALWPHLLRYTSCASKAEAHP